MGFIYKITNTVSKKCYIGITTKKDPEDRWKGHLYSIKNGTGCPLLMKAFNKYGEDNFKFEVLIICFDEDLHKYEKDYIVKYKSLVPNGYNAHEGGEFGGNFLGKKHSEETKKKIGLKSKEYNNNKEVREKARIRMLKFNQNNNVGELMRQSIKWKLAEKSGRAGKGRKLSEETKLKISLSLKQYFNDNKLTNNKKNHSEIMTKVNGKQIEQYSKDNKLIASFDSIILASKATSIGRSSIQANASGRTKTAGGFIWKYSTKETELKDFAIK